MCKIRPKETRSFHYEKWGFELSKVGVSVGQSLRGWKGAKKGGLGLFMAMVKIVDDCSWKGFSGGWKVEGIFRGRRKEEGE